MPETTDMTEFDDIISQLREERPEIDPAFARELDNRASAGFPRKRRRFAFPKVSIFTPGMAIGATAILIVTVAIISGSSGPSGDSLSSGGSGGSVAAAPKQSAESARDATGAAAGEPMLDEVAPSTSSSSGSLAQPPVEGGARGRIVEQTASLTLIAPSDEVADVGDKVLGVADQVGGFVVSSQVRATDGESGGGDFLLRVPTARLDDALGRLSRLAHVQERQQGVQDITTERNSVRDQLEEATAERTSLLKRLADADTDNEVTSLRARLRDVNTAIATYKDSLTRVNRRAQFASLSVTLAAKTDKGGAPVDDGKWTPGDAVKDAGRVLEVVAGVVVVVGSVLLPLALLVLLFVAAQRINGRRGRERALDAV